MLQWWTLLSVPCTVVNSGVQCWSVPCTTAYSGVQCSSVCRCSDIMWRTVEYSNSVQWGTVGYRVRYSDYSQAFGVWNPPTPTPYTHTFYIRFIFFKHSGLHNILKKTKPFRHYKLCFKYRIFRLRYKKIEHMLHFPRRLSTSLQLFMNVYWKHDKI